MSASADEAAPLRRTSFAATGFTSSFPLALPISSFSFPVSFPLTVLLLPLSRSLSDRIGVTLMGGAIIGGTPLACSRLGSAQVDSRLATGNIRIELLRTSNVFRAF